MTCFTCNRNHPSLNHGMALLTGIGTMYLLFYSLPVNMQKQGVTFLYVEETKLFSIYRKSQGVKNFTLVAHAISSPINLTSQGDVYKVRFNSSEVRLNKTLEISENSENPEKTNKFYKSSGLSFLIFLMFNLT